MERIHADLYIDILHKNDLGYVFSDAYDLVQEGALYLCEHYGKHLSDVIGYNKKASQFYRECMLQENDETSKSKKIRDNCRNICYEALTHVNEPHTVVQDEKMQYYTDYDKIVENLNLTINMRIALECRIKGLSFHEIGSVLSHTKSTVFEYFIKMRKRYTAIYG